MRIEKVSENESPFWLRALYWLMRRRNGTVPAPLLVYGWKPPILMRFLGLGRAVRASGQLPERLKRLAMYWTARQVECAF